MEVKITKILNLDSKPERESPAVDGEVYGGFCWVHYGQKNVSLIVGDKYNISYPPMSTLPTVTSFNLY